MCTHAMSTETQLIFQAYTLNCFNHLLPLLFAMLNCGSVRFGIALVGSFFSFLKPKCGGIFLNNRYCIITFGAMCAVCTLKAQILYYTLYRLMISHAFVLHFNSSELQDFGSNSLQFFCAALHFNIAKKMKKNRTIVDILRYGVSHSGDTVCAVCTFFGLT